MVLVKNSDIVIPNLTNAEAWLNELNRVVVQMNDGYVMIDRSDYTIDGVYTEPENPEEMIYYRRLTLSPLRDFSLLYEELEANVPNDWQICGGGNNTETVTE